MGEYKGLNEIENAVIIMLKNALNGSKVSSDFLDHIDDGLLFELCQSHKISALASLALSMENERWKNARLDSVRRTVLFDNERRQIVKSFEENRIWYCPLKGVILKDFYPEYGTREMADNDILVDGLKRELIYQLMTEKGYTCTEYGTSYRDPYSKLPIYNFEMHHALFNEYNGRLLVDYYTDIKKRLIRNEDHDYGYHFSDEDFYVYYIAHNHKHFSSGGSGIRTLVDIYVFLREKKELNWDYIQTELKKIGLSDEEEGIRVLSEKLFGSEDPLTEKETELLKYMFSSGTYGSLKNKTMNKLDDYKKTTKFYKLNYLYRRLFPEEDWLKAWYPEFYRHKLLRPFLFPYRLAKGLLKSRQKISKEIEMVRNERKNDADV